MYVRSSYFCMYVLYIRTYDTLCTHVAQFRLHACYQTHVRLFMLLCSVGIMCDVTLGPVSQSTPILLLSHPHTTVVQCLCPPNTVSHRYQCSVTVRDMCTLRYSRNTNSFKVTSFGLQKTFVSPQP